MPDFSWLEQEDDLTSEGLTVRAQTISPNDDGSLLWDGFFPRVDADSVKLHEITTLDFRPASDRREWNQGGRHVPLKTPDLRDIEMTPIESFFKVGEREIQELAERTFGNEAQFRELIRARIPERSDGLVIANFRRIEIEAFEAWADGQVTVRNPETGGTLVVSFNFDSSRHQTAGTAWDDGAVNAYDEFLAWIEDAEDKVGQVRGAMLRRATLKAIQEDAPNPMPGAQADLQPTQQQLRQRIQDELGQRFDFFINEKSVDEFDDAGIDYTRNKIWPAGHVAAVPEGMVVGATHFAPVARAMELARRAREAGIDVRGQTVYHNASQDAKNLEVQAQVNALTVPDEQRVDVIDTLVT